MLVPHPDVNVNRERHLWIKCVPAPFPVTGSDHGGQVACTAVILRSLSGISKSEQSLYGSVDKFWRAVEIDIRLHAQTGMGDVVRIVREPFQNYMFDMRGLKCERYFSVSRPDSI